MLNKVKKRLSQKDDRDDFLQIYFKKVLNMIFD